MYDYDISADGKLLGTQNKDDMLILTADLFHSKEKLRSQAFIKKSEASGKPKGVSYSIALTPSGETLIRLDPKNSSFDLYYFKN